MVHTTIYNCMHVIGVNLIPVSFIINSHQDILYRNVGHAVPTVLYDIYGIHRHIVR